LDKAKYNLKTTWKILNNAINRNKQPATNHSFKYNHRNITDAKQISNCFNNYFINIGKSLSKTIPPQQSSPLNHLTGNYVHSLYIYPASEEELLRIINKLKNTSAGHDDLSVKALKAAMESLLTPLTHLCNLSLQTGEIPGQLKIAKITPIYKSGDKDCFSNYRPISVLPVISKIFEKLMYNRLIEYIEQNEIFYENQFGFRRGRSTSMALTILIDKLHTAMDHNFFTLGVYLDLSKAFDTVDHRILLQKLQFYGIRGVALDWLKNYLSDRQQYVYFNGANSSMGKISCGVPQGSILGPLLFLLYVNDMHTVCRSSFILLFADDTNIFVSGKSLLEVEQTINNELKALSNWFKLNKLSLNIHKTKFMIIKSRKKNINPQRLNINIDNINIQQVQYTKFLGVVIDEHLTWDNHIKYTTSKMAKITGILYKSRHRLNRIALRMLYNTLVLPYITYCLIIWGKTYNKHIKRVQVAQNKLLRLITFSDYRASAQPLFIKLKLMTVEQLYKYNIIIFMYKYTNKHFPNNFNHLFMQNNENHQYNTRQSDRYRHNMPMQTITSFNIKTQGPLIWNKCPQEIRKSKSLHTLKRKLKRIINTL